MWLTEDWFILRYYRTRSELREKTGSTAPSQSGGDFPRARSYFKPRTVSAYLEINDNPTDAAVFSGQAYGPLTSGIDSKRGKASACRCSATSFHPNSQALSNKYVLNPMLNDGNRDRFGRIRRTSAKSRAGVDSPEHLESSSVK